jgi:hypothetical protein
VNLLIVIHYPVFGGPHNQALRLARSFEREGISVTVLLPQQGKRRRPPARRRRRSGHDPASSRPRDGASGSAARAHPAPPSRGVGNPNRDPGARDRRRPAPGAREPAWCDRGRTRAQGRGMAATRHPRTDGRATAHDARRSPTRRRCDEHGAGGRRRASRRREARAVSLLPSGRRRGVQGRSHRREQHEALVRVRGRRPRTHQRWQSEPAEGSRVLSPGARDPPERRTPRESHRRCIPRYACRLWG